MEWTKEQARRYLINYHFLHQQASSFEEIFDRLDTIQYDPLNVVGTNPELVLQARIPDFHAEDLDELLYQKRTLIDGWDKQMSIYRVEDFPRLQPLREARSLMELRGLETYLNMDIKPFIYDVQNIIRDRGPILSRDIQLGESLSHKWGRTKPSSATIDYLFHQGIIGVHSRIRTHKKYDLIERLIPDVSKETHRWKPSEFNRWYLLRRVRNTGLCWNKTSDLYGGLFLRKKTERTPLFHQLVKDGLIEEVHIEGISDVCYKPTNVPDLSTTVPDRLTFLAPLDNVNWDRTLLEELFGFYYRWEVYTPSAKRQYGYYVLPMLYQDRFVGRIEFDHFKTDTLTIKHIWWEDGVDVQDMTQPILDALQRFRSYLGAKRIVGLDSSSKQFVKSLT